MKARKRFVRSAFGLVIVVALGLVAIGLSRVARAQGTTNLVYVESNITTTGGNTIIGFSNSGGVLTPLSGSPFSTGGTGVGAGGTGFQFDADQEVIVNPQGTLLFAVNGDSDDISVFSIDSTGNLTPVGTPVASGGQDPASLGLRENALRDGTTFLIVVNKNSDPNQTGGTPNYTTFTVDKAGNMTENPGSTFDLAAGASPAQALVSPLSVEFFGIEFMSQRVVTYHLTKTGLLRELSSSTPPVTSPVPLGAAIDPKFTNDFFVGLPLTNAIAFYQYSSKGVLTFVNDFADAGKAVCWLAFNAGGTVLYASETDSGTVTAYKVGNPSTPVQLQHFVLRDVIKGVHAATLNLVVDPTGKYLYVLDSGDALHVLSISSTGTLSEPNNPVPLGSPKGTRPMGLAALMK